MTAVELGVDQLIEKVRTQALDRAKTERDTMMRDAQQKADALIEEANARALKIIQDAELKVEQERKALAVELELSARDFTIKLSERIKSQLCFPVIKQNIRATLKEPDFLKEVLERVIESFVKNNTSLDIIIAKEMRVTLAAFFASSVFDALEKDGNLRLKDEEGIEGFVLIKRGEHYLWDFRVETIAQELMRLVEPSLRKYFSSFAQAA